MCRPCIGFLFLKLAVDNGNENIYTFNCDCGVSECLQIKIYWPSFRSGSIKSVVRPPRYDSSVRNYGYATENIFGRSDPHYPDHSYHTAAIFFDSLENRVFSEKVKLNGISIPSQGINGNITESPESFGATQHWEVIPEDSTALPYIDDSILAPNLFRITYPRPITDTVSIDTGFTLKYEDPGTDSVRIEFFYDSVETTHLFDSTIHHSRGASIEMMAANTGLYNVSSGVLSSFPSSGLIQIWVKARRDKVITVSGGKCLLLSTSSARTYCFIKN